jgi:hypothetical protein
VICLIAPGKSCGRMCRDTGGAAIAGSLVGPRFAGRDDGEECSRSDCFANKSGVSGRGLRLTMGSNMPANSDCTVAKGQFRKSPNLREDANYRGGMHRHYGFCATLRANYRWARDVMPWTLLDHVIGSCLCVSFKFGRASAPMCPQRSHRSLGPNDGTGISLG